MGCKSICLGNVISQKDFYHIQNAKKKYDVMFYGGLKFQGGSRQQILEFLKQRCTYSLFWQIIWLRFWKRTKQKNK